MMRAFATVLLLLTAAVPLDDTFDRTVDALAVGSQAAEIGDRTRLHSAAVALRMSGAQPVAGDDVAALWLRRTRSHEPTPDRDRALGPGYRALALNGGDSATFEQTFLAGQRARIAVIPVRRSAFTLSVSDGSARTCEGSPRLPRCDWVPSYTSRFSIRIANPAAGRGQYFVVVK